MRKNSANEVYQGINELFNYESVKKWYENMGKSSEGKTLTQLNSEFKTKYQKSIPVTNSAGQSDEFKNKLNKLWSAGAPGTLPQSGQNV